MSIKNIVIDSLILIAIALCIVALVFSYSNAEAEEPTCEATTATITEETQVTMTEPTEEETTATEETEPLQTVHTETQQTEMAQTMTEREMLALVIYQEAGGDGCSDETRLMVGTVVMNRVASDRFPNTIYGVLTQRAQYGRLSWTGLVWPQRASNLGEAHAVERAYECADKILSGYRSFDSGVVWQAEFPQGTETVAYQDGTYFCK